MEQPCAEHSGLVMSIRNILEAIKRIEDNQESFIAKLDLIVAQQNSANVIMAVDKTENKWRHRFMAATWGLVGGIVGSGATVVLSLALDKYISE